MAASLTSIPVEEYLRTCYEPDMEYVDGHLVERHVGEYDHSRLQGLIYGALLARERARRFRTFPEQRIRVSDSPRYRIPDICVKALPHQRMPVLTQPDLVIEILSPDDESSGTLDKIADYAGAGIPYVWIVDPYKRNLVVVEQGVIRNVSGHVLETPLVGPVDFADLFRQLDEPSE